MRRKRQLYMALKGYRCNDILGSIAAAIFLWRGAISYEHASDRICP